MAIKKHQEDLLKNTTPIEKSKKRTRRKKNFKRLQQDRATQASTSTDRATQASSQSRKTIRSKYTNK